MNFGFSRHSSLLGSRSPVLMGKLTEVKIITGLCVINGTKKGVMYHEPAEKY